MLKSIDKILKIIISFDMRKKLLKLLHQNTQIISQSKLAKSIGINQTTLMRIMNGSSYGTMRTWEKISKYYNGKKSY